MVELRRVLKYAALRETEVNSPSVSAAEKNELVTLFQANALTEGSVTEESRAQIELLKSVIGVGSPSASG